MKVTKMKRIQLLITVFCITTTLFAQYKQDKVPQEIQDSIKEAYLDKTAFKNPAMRQASFLANVHGGSALQSNLNGDKLFDAQMISVRYFGKFSMPVIHKGKNIISTAFGLRHEQVQITDIVNYNSELTVQERDFDKSLVNLEIHYTRLDTLFNRPLTLSTKVGGMVDPKTGQHRFTFSSIGLLKLKRTQNFSISAGLIFSVDPIAPIPVIPFFTMYKKFGESGLELTLNPAGVALIKNLNEKSTLSFSNRIDGSLIMFEFDNSQLPSAGTYSTLEIKSGLTYERLVGKKVVLTFSTGLSSALNSRTLEQGKTGDPFIQNKQSAVVYGQFGVSLLPFWEGFSRHN